MPNPKGQENLSPTSHNKSQPPLSKDHEDQEEQVILRDETVQERVNVEEVKTNVHYVQEVREVEANVQEIQNVQLPQTSRMAVHKQITTYENKKPSQSVTKSYKE